MDANQIDGIAKALCASAPRRGVLGLLAVIGMGRAPLDGEKTAAKNRKKRKKRNRNGPNASPCANSPKETCEQSRCYEPVCDVGVGVWACRNVCAGTSAPKCLSGQCVEPCEELGLTECGESCCDGECCVDVCCNLG